MVNEDHHRAQYSQPRHREREPMFVPQGRRVDFMLQDLPDGIPASAVIYGMITPNRDFLGRNLPCASGAGVVGGGGHGYVLPSARV